MKDNKSLTLLLLHGTGGNENDLIPIAGMLRITNASILSPRGKVLENGMPRFFRRLAEGVFDVEDLKFRINLYTILFYILLQILELYLLLALYGLNERCKKQKWQ